MGTAKPRLPPWAVYGLSSVLLLAPCWWQSRIQAGDLSSHIYNAWLAELIRKGEAEGLHIAAQPTNVLFDLLLGALMRNLGAPAAERIAVSMAVLLLTWGAFALVCAVSRRRPWFLLPCLAMLAYGWVFHMGFFNFYLSLGLGLWALALAQRRKPAWVVPLLILACLAHALGALWTLCVLGYGCMAARLAPRRRMALLAAGAAAILLFGFVLAHAYPCRWDSGQLGGALAVNQVMVYGAAYRLIAVALLVTLGLYAFTLRPVRVALGIPFQCAALTALVVLAVPTEINLPVYASSLAFVSERMSLALGIAVCAVLARARPKAWQAGLGGAVALVFFGCLYADERAINAFEDKLEAAVARLQPGDRVVNTVWGADDRVPALLHAIDRVCVNRCFSYGNYEPSTGQFRVRAAGPNRIVAPSAEMVSAIQAGNYTAREADLPLYAVDLCAGELCLKPLRAGSRAEIRAWR